MKATGKYYQIPIKFHYFVLLYTIKGSITIDLDFLTWHKNKLDTVLCHLGNDLTHTS